MCAWQQINTLRFISFKIKKAEKRNSIQIYGHPSVVFDEQESTTDFTSCHHEIKSHWKREINPKPTMESFNLLVRCLLLEDKVKKLVIYKRRGRDHSSMVYGFICLFLMTHLTTLNSSYNTSNTIQINQYVFSINHSIASINKIIFVSKRFLGRATAMELSGVQDTLVNVNVDTFFSVWPLFPCVVFVWHFSCFSCVTEVNNHYSIFHAILLNIVLILRRYVGFLLGVRLADGFYWIFGGLKRDWGFWARSLMVRCIIWVEWDYFLFFSTRSS